MSTQTQHIRFETIARVLESHSGPTTEEMGFTQTSGDSCLYVRQDSEGETFVVAVYMDDIILGGKGEAKLNAVKEELCQSFKMKDVGPLHHFLEVKIVQRQEVGLIWISQPLYTEKVL